MTDADLDINAEQKLRLECVRTAISAKAHGERKDLLKLAEEIASFVVGQAGPEVVVEETAAGTAPVSPL